MGRGKCCDFRAAFPFSSSRTFGIIPNFEMICCDGVFAMWFVRVEYLRVGLLVDLRGVGIVGDEGFLCLMALNYCSLESRYRDEFPWIGGLVLSSA